MIVIAWEFRVHPGQSAAFERAYGPEGDWARLFRKSPAYHGTELLRDPDDPERYLTLDRWDGAADFARSTAARCTTRKGVRASAPLYLSGTVY